MNKDEDVARLCAPDAAVVGYAFLRHLGLILDELSAQGLELWQDERRRWSPRTRGWALARRCRSIGTGLLGAWRGDCGCGRDALSAGLCNG